MDLLAIYLWLAVIFGFIMAWGIGANDVSNAMGASVGSKAITIRQAIVIAAIFEFLGAYLAGGEVTSTIRENILTPELYADEIHMLCIGMIASLMSAGAWLLIASIFGWPVSTTHTIVGAIIGFATTNYGLMAVQWEFVLYILSGWIFSPFLGATISYAVFTSTQILIFDKDDPFNAAKSIAPLYILITCWIVFMMVLTQLDTKNIDLTIYESATMAFGFSSLIAIFGKYAINKIELKPKDDKKFNYTNVEKIFSVLMVFTACAMAFAHGSNDVANATGPISSVVSAVRPPSNFSGEEISGYVPSWILVLGACGIVLGLAMYGHRVIATVGTKITQLTPSRGFAATLATASTVLLASSTGLPISTTHTLVGGILGIGLARGVHALNINVIRTIFMSWVITLPAGAFLSIVFYHTLSVIFNWYSPF